MNYAYVAFLKRIEIAMESDAVKEIGTQYLSTLIVNSNSMTFR